MVVMGVSPQWIVALVVLAVSAPSAEARASRGFALELLRVDTGSRSMVPSLRPQDVVLIRRTARVDVGDAVVFWAPGRPSGPGMAMSDGNGLAYANDPLPRRLAAGPSSIATIKRVAAIEGMVVSLVNGRPVVDGLVTGSPCPPGSGPLAAALPRSMRPAEVPAGHVFLLGDNCGTSIDSRVWGPIPARYVWAKAVAVVWPPGRMQLGI